ncbi:MAG: transcriptional regulator [Thalassobius sp.]|nr:transcriptional regulator [Thalassovita sp.]
MELDKAKMEFVQTWGALGSSWGIPRSMAQIHALLLSNKNELSTEEIMEAIQLSRGNVNINLRELINWKLVSKQNKLGERKEFFAANHNIWEISKNIMQERKRRELQPVQDLLIALKNETLEGDSEEVLHFKEMVKSLDEFISQMDQLSELMIKLNDNMFFKKVIQMFQNK